MQFGITPACAGNTVVKQVADNMFEDHPRLRGEYMFQNSAYGNKWGSPPLARGILDTMGDIEFPIGITPACAGNTDAINGCDYVVGDHPRLRGEYLLVRLLVGLLTGSPPLARGIPSSTRRKTSSSRITPACAGNTG